MSQPDTIQNRIALGIAGTGIIISGGTDLVHHVKNTKFTQNIARSGRFLGTFMFMGGACMLITGINSSLNSLRARESEKRGQLQRLKYMEQ